MDSLAGMNDKASLIWNIADSIINVYKPGEYGKVILPMTVLKRFDDVLSDTKEKVVEKATKLPETMSKRDLLLKEVAGHNFYNTSKYDFKKLLAEPDNIDENFKNYLAGFSDNAKDIIENFRFEEQIDRMNKGGVLYQVIQEFNSPKADLSPDKVSNIQMGAIFEEIIRRFSESSNEDAGQHYTPREVIELMVNLVFSNDEDLAETGKIKTIYDGACGTGGMLTASEEYIKKINKSAKVVCYGEEMNPETYAICKADMLIKSNTDDTAVDNIVLGNTLSHDAFSGQTFDYIIMNPPFGLPWKNEKSAVEAEAKKGFEGRFGAGTPAISDSQLLFLENAVSKMTPKEKGGGKVAIIHNGSALFKGDAGSGESEIRRYIVEHDLLDAIIQLPNDIFYNTGISTYIWILDNNKPEYRKGKIQLIDASKCYKQRRKSLGSKRNDLNNIDYITKVYGEFKENEISKIHNNEYFLYRKETTIVPKLDENGNAIKGKFETDTETIPYEKDIDEYMKEEVLPYSPEAKIDKKKEKIGCEIPFTKEFYKYVPPRSTEEIMKDIKETDKELDEILKELVKNAER